MSDKHIEELMSRFELVVDAFAVCEISRTTSLAVSPMDKILVHFVLAGEGVLETCFGRRDLRRGTVVIVPRHLPKVLAGAGPIERTMDASGHCPLADGLVSFKAGQHPDLIIGCAAVNASLGGVIDVFEHLYEPMCEDCVAESVSPLMNIIREELASPGIGSRAIVSGLMKNVLLAVFRKQLAAESFRTWLWPAMMHPQLGRAAMAMMARPEDPHTIDSLAATAGLSRSQFCELFPKSFGRSPREFLQVVRLRAAKRLLISSSLPIKSVAAAVGYASRSQFSRAFQEEFGDAPGAFRLQQELVLEHMAA